MAYISYTDIYFAIASVATIAVAGLVIVILFYILSITRDVKKVSRIARKEAELVARSFAKGASILGAELSEGAAGFLQTMFSLLIAKAVKPKRRTRIVKE